MKSERNRNEPSTKPRTDQKSSQVAGRKKGVGQIKKEKLHNGRDRSRAAEDDA